jgi:predicted acetyltransferase
MQKISMISWGEDTSQPALKEMWKQCFPADSESFIHFYFDKICRNEETLVFLENERPVASLQMIPYQIKTGDEMHEAGYLSGVMTHPDYRKRGYMERLLNASFDEMVKKDYDYAFLIPQEKNLVDMYLKYGFRLCESSRQPPENIVMKTSRQWAQIQQDFFDENGVWLENEPIFPNEHKGMIKRLNPAVKEITTLYMGMMFD